MIKFARIFTQCEGKQPTMWYKASIVAEVDSIQKYISVLCVKIYMAGKLAKMLVARSIVVNLQGCSSHSVNKLANSAKIKRFLSS